MKTGGPTPSKHALGHRASAIVDPCNGLIKNVIVIWRIYLVS